MVNEKSKQYMVDTLNEGADKYQDVASYRKVSAALCLMVGAIATAAGSLSTTCDYLNTGDKAIMWIAAVAALGAQMYADGQYEAAEEHAPEYLRSSQAERVRGEKQEEQSGESSVEAEIQKAEAGIVVKSYT